MTTFNYILLVFFVIHFPQYLQSAPDRADFLKSKTPTLDSHEELNSTKLSKYTIDLKVDVKTESKSKFKDKDADDYTFGTIKKSQYLEIQITNFTNYEMLNFIIKYKIFAKERKHNENEFKRIKTNLKKPYNNKKSEIIVADEGELQFNEQLKYMEKKSIRTDSIDSEYTKRSDADNYWSDGQKYDGFLIEIFDEEDALVARKERI